MSNYIKTNILCMGFLSAFALIACSHDAAMSQNFGTTEEKNAFWDESSNLKAWKVMKGSEIKLEANKNTLMGRVSLDKSGADNFARAGIVYDVSNTDGSPTNLSMDNDGLCIAYQSDFIVEVRLDTADYANSSVDKDLPFVSMSERDSVTGSQCVSWKDFKMKNSDDVDCSDFAKKVRSVQLVFVGESGSSGNFDIQRLTPFVRLDLWFGKKDYARVETGFAKGDEGTSGEMIFIEDSSEAYLEWAYSIRDIVPDWPYSEIDANIVFSDSNSNPDVGFEFLVAGKTTKNDQDFIYTADVSGLWMGMCLEYKSQMDIVMELVPGDSLTGTLENNVKTMTFAKNNSEENTCIEFAEVFSGSDSEILKHLAKIRVKFAKENNAGTKIYMRRISALVPENLSVRKYGENREVIPTDSSEYKSGKSFLWNAAVDGAHLNLGISNAPSGGIWANSPEQSDRFHYNFPDDVVADENGNFIPSLVSKYHGFEGYMKFRFEGRDDCIDIDCSGTIGFNTVSSNLEPADISAWDGFCIHYSTHNTIRIIIVTDVSAKKYWYADVEYSDDMVWGKVSWDAFKNIDEDSDEQIEDVLGRVTKILLLPYEGKNFVDKFGSYDQCGN